MVLVRWSNEHKACLSINGGNKCGILHSIDIVVGNLESLLDIFKCLKELPGSSIFMWTFLFPCVSLFGYVTSKFLMTQLERLLPTDVEVGSVGRVVVEICIGCILCQDVIRKESMIQPTLYPLNNCIFVLDKESRRSHDTSFFRRYAQARCVWQVRWRRLKSVPNILV